ncbi:hypothetical protein DFJ74DRAFT_640131 [Hyaloraphidium curvatum]|nr:hypothetical protein DFJ74DRAFT_640131 [Hyaloraphidium curvatum]
MSDNAAEKPLPVPQDVGLATGVAPENGSSSAIPLQELPKGSADVEAAASTKAVHPSKCCVCGCCFPAYKRWGPGLRTLFISAIVFAILAVAAVAFILYCVIGVYPANSQAYASLATVPGAVYSNEYGWHVFRTPTPAPGRQVGLVFLPGAKVDPVAYAPMCQNLVLAGNGTVNTCVVVYAPLNLAFFALGKPGEVANANPQIESWIVGGHSLGGAMASQVFASTHPANRSLWQGLQTLAAYSTINMNSPTFTTPPAAKVVAFQGTLDGVQTMSDFQAKVGNFPPAPETEIIYIEGGNHAQMGYCWLITSVPVPAR